MPRLCVALPTNILVAAVCVASLQVVACDRSPGYRGDGTLTDFGPSTAHGRYAIDLGPIDLSRPNQRSYKMLGLPQVEFTMGLRQVNVSARCDAAALGSVRVRLGVRSDDGVVIVTEDAPLSAWVVSPDLMYRRGAEHEEPKAGGAFELVRSGVRASGGWGTYFTPQRTATYLAQLEVLDAHGLSGCESRLVLLGGGWK